METDGSDVQMATPPDVAAAVDEQAAGAEILNAGLPKTRKAQSQVAAEKLAKAGMN